MAIVLESTVADDAGFPIVSWWEDRDLLKLAGKVRVWCYITPDPKDGTLLFATSGSDRVGDNHNFRQWETLQGFGHKPASALYDEPLDRYWKQILQRSLPKTGTMLEDHAFVTIADFEDGTKSVPLHLNCALASEHDRALLHDELRRHFIQRRDFLVRKHCRKSEPYVWPAGKIPFVPPRPAEIPRHIEHLVTAAVVIVLVSLAVSVLWFGGLIRF